MKWWRPVLLGLGVVGVVVGVFLLAKALGVTSVADLRRMTAEAGPWAPLLFVALHGLICVAPFPRTVFTLAAGALFGWAGGVALALAGSAISAVLAFFLVRATGGALVSRYVRGSAVTWARRRLDHHGTLAVTSLRLVPAIPFAPLNYLCGLSTVRFIPFVVGTMVGIFPGTTAIVILGDAVGGTPSPASFSVSVVCGLIGLTGLVVAARRPLPDEDADVAPEPDATPESAPGPMR